MLEAGALGVAGIAGAGTALSDAVKATYIDHSAINTGAVAFDSTLAPATAGLIELTPGVPGVKPKLFSEAYFTGAHAANQALGTVVSTVAGGTGMGSYNAIYSSANPVSHSSRSSVGVSSLAR